MIVGGKKNHFHEGVGIGDTVDFNIALTREAFTILSKSIYSRPTDSIVRELASNAYDSHVRAGKADVPFTIRLPSLLDPTFSIRDYGVGMSDGDIRDTYSCYFRSTKRDSNDELGGFGLGCKTPFSYTDQFTITSIHDGQRGVYVAHMGNNGPKLTCMGIGPSDEPSGLEVSFPVERGDEWKFSHAVKEELHYFTTRPTVIGEDFSFKDGKTPILAGKGWELLPRHYRDEQVTVLLSQVAYPMTASTSNELQTLLLALNAQLLVEVPVGSVNVSVSREQLSYDDFTLAYMGKRLEEIYQEIVVLASERFAHYKADYDKQWDAAQAYEKFVHDGENHRLWVALGKPSLITNRGVDVVASTVDLWTEEYAAIADKSSRDEIVNKIGYVFLSHRSGKPVLAHRHGSPFSPIIYRDVRRITPSRIFDQYHNGIVLEGDRALIDQHLLAIGYNKPLLLASEVVKIKVEPRGESMYFFGRSSDRATQWESFFIRGDFDETRFAQAFYMVVKNYTPIIPDRYREIITSPTILHTITSGLGVYLAAKQQTFRLYGVTERFASKYDISARCFWDFLDEVLVPDSPLVRQHADSLALGKHLSTNPVVNTITHHLRWVSPSKIRTAFSDYPDLGDVMAKAWTIHHRGGESGFLKYFNIDVEPVRYITDEEISARYPFLSHVVLHTSTPEKAIEEAIKYLRYEDFRRET